MNRLYVRRKGGGVALTKEAHRYREHVKKVVMENLHEVSNLPVDLETQYSFHVTVYFKALENAGWWETFSRGEKKGQRKAATRYKKIDVDNRVKFIQDCVIKSLGIPDDSQVFEGSQRKRVGEEEAAVVVVEVIGP